MVVPVAMVRWTSVGLTDRGLRRARNEDAFLLRPDARICAVADGMGGHAAGNVASRIAIDVLSAAFPRAPSPRIRASTLARRLLSAFDAANQAILDHAARHRECGGMGTTLTALAPLVSAPQCVIAHIGDSRAYRVRAGSLVQLTRDHTWVQQQVDAGMLSAIDARHHPLSSVLSRVLGTAAVGPADTFVADVEPGDTFMICSDGLTTMVEDEEILSVLDRPLPLEQRARDLITAANLRGGVDNTTVVLLSSSDGQRPS